MQTTDVAEEAATMPYDSPLLRVHSLRSDEGSIKLNELMVLCTTLSKKVETLESDLKQTKLTYGATYTKLIMKVKKWKHRSKSQVNKLEEGPDFQLEYCWSKKLVLSQPEVKTVAESLVYIKRSAAKRKDKGKAIMKEAEPVQNKTKLQLEQERLGSLYLRHKEGVNTFTLMESDDTVPKVVAGSSKIDVEQELIQESLKRQKIGEDSEPAEESKDELSQEQLQQLMIIVPEEGMNIEAL
ncbi:hypothetical protein Tco_1300383 [Tanacetum coccineum]